MSNPLVIGEIRRRITYRLRVAEFIADGTLVVVEDPDNGRRFVHTPAEVAAWPVVTSAPLTAGFACPVDGIRPTAASKPGSVSPTCEICGRFVVQVEDTGDEPF